MSDTLDRPMVEARPYPGSKPIVHPLAIGGGQFVECLAARFDRFLWGM